MSFINTSILCIESEEEDRVVRSAKDRTWENIYERVTKIRSAMKISDWGTIHDEFDDINNQIKKAKMLTMQHGFPPFYIKMLVEVEDLVNATVRDKEAQAKMKPGVLRVLNRMKIRVRQHNKEYDVKIAQCRENPDAFKDPDSMSAKKQSKAAVSDSGSDSDDSDSESGSDSDSASSESSEVLYVYIRAVIVKLLCEIQLDVAVTLHSSFPIIDSERSRVMRQTYSRIAIF